jgi:3-oxoadipate enol-lactonase
MLLPIDGRRLHYDLVGTEEGPIVCMVHSLASDGGMWAEQIPPLLQAGFRVLRVDLCGHGGSDPVPGRTSIRALAEDVLAVLDALAFARVHYIGLSIGGMIGQALALKHGCRLISAMWCDTLPASPTGASATWSERTAAVRQADSLAPLADATMERWFTAGFRLRNPGRWKQIRETVASTKPAGFLACAAALLDFNFVAQLPSVRVPTLVVCGADDQSTPPLENRVLARLVPGSRYEEIPDARHLCNVERADLFNGIMTAWLASVRACA